MARYQSSFSTGLVIALSMLPVLAMLSPRALAFVIPLSGLAGYLTARPVFGYWPPISRFAALWTLVTVGLMGISILWAVNPDFALERTLKTAGLLTGGVLLISLCASLPADQMRIFSRVFPACLGLAALIMLFELNTTGFFHHLLRGEAVTSDFNFSALNRSVEILTVSAFIGIACIRRLYTGWKRLFILGILAVIFAVIMLQTESQSSQLALGLGLLFTVFFPYKSRLAWLILIAVKCAAILAAPWIAQALFDTLPPLIKHYEWFQNSYAAHRMEIWDFISRRALESPWIGHGVEATRFYDDFDTQRLYHPSSEILHPHNLFIQIWIEYGLAGAVILCIFMTHMLLRISELPPRLARVTLPTFMACVSIGTTGYGLWQGWWLATFMMMGALITISLHVLPAEKPAGDRYG